MWAVLSILSLGLYDPWNKRYEQSFALFKEGLARATCEICGYAFTVMEKVNVERIRSNRHMLLLGVRKWLERRLSQESANRIYPQQ